jgi:hypothetical protein
MQSSSETNSRSSSQEIINLLRNPIIYNNYHKSLSLVPLLSQMNLAQTLLHICLWFILILSTHLRLDLQNCKFASGFLNQNFEATVTSTALHCTELCTALIYVKSKSKLLYDWRFTVNQFVLASGPLRLTTRFFFQLNSCGNSPYVTSSLTRRWVCLLWICSAFYNPCTSEIIRRYVCRSSSVGKMHE